jgi:hypothetical protein
MKLSYARVARFWAIVFFTVCLLFLLMPHRTGEALTGLANKIGLAGNIAMPTDNLWYVLALSFMAIITICAWTSAAHPAHRETYYGLLVAKTISSVGFLVMALHAPAWAICALGDGFVALTLWCSHRQSDKAALSLSPLARVYHGQSPFYEVWFGKIDVAPQTAFWFHYELLDGKCAEAGAFAVLFEPSGVKGGKTVFPLQELAPANCLLLPAQDTARFRGKPQVFTVGTLRLDAANALGETAGLSWDLSFQDAGRRFEHVPRLLKMARLSKSTLSSCHLDLRFSGIIRVQERETRLDNARGMIGHIYGKRHAYEWAWVHANSFVDESDVVFEGIAARLTVAGLRTPPLSSFVLYVGERQYAFSSVWRLVAEKSLFGDGRWQFKAKANGATIEGEVIAPAPENIAVVAYTDTDGTPMWCRNSKLSTLNLRLNDSRRGIVKNFLARGTAAFEIGTRQPQGGLTV